MPNAWTSDQERQIAAFRYHGWRWCRRRCGGGRRQQAKGPRHHVSAARIEAQRRVGARRADDQVDPDVGGEIARGQASARSIARASAVDNQIGRGGDTSNAGARTTDGKHDSGLRPAGRIAVGRFPGVL